MSSLQYQPNISPAATHSLNDLTPPALHPCIPAVSERNQRLLQATLDGLSLNYEAQRTAVENGRVSTVRLQECEKVFLLDAPLGLPRQWTALTKSLIDDLKNVADNSLTSTLTRAFAQREEHLSDFSTDTLNAFNARYFEARGAFAGLPPLYTNNIAVARAFARHLDKNLPAGSVTIKELCAGEGSLHRWAYFFMDSTVIRTTTLLLCDGSFSQTPKSIKTGFRNAQARTEHLNLLKPLTPLAPEERVDGIVCCYGFDSVWFPADSFVVTHKGNWYEALFRVGVPDWHPARAEVIEAFKQEDASNLSVRDFEPLIIERALRPYDPAHDVLAGDAVQERLKDHHQGALSVPRGLVMWVEEAFERQLKPNGRIIIGDAGPYDKKISSVHAFLEPGCPAKAKPLDFHLAQTMLTARGFTVSVTPMEEFVRGACGDSWREQASFEDEHGVLQPYQYIMEVSRT